MFFAAIFLPLFSEFEISTFIYNIILTIHQRGLSSSFSFCLRELILEADFPQYQNPQYNHEHRLQGRARRSPPLSWPLIVYFTANWCPECRILFKVIEITSLNTLIFLCWPSILWILIWLMNGISITLSNAIRKDGRVNRRGFELDFVDAMLEDINQSSLISSRIIWTIYRIAFSIFLAWRKNGRSELSSILSIPTDRFKEEFLGDTTLLRIA